MSMTLSQLLSQIDSLSVFGFGLKEDPIARINKDQHVATDQEGKCKGVLHRPLDQTKLK